MDIRNKRNEDELLDLLEGTGVVFIEDGKAHQIDAEGGAFVDLLAHFIDLFGLDGAHALDEDFLLSPKLHTPDKHGSSFVAVCHTLTFYPFSLLVCVDFPLFL